MDWDSQLPQLGDRVREIVSGYTGVVTGCVRYLWGCEQVLVARADEKGKPESDWFDVGRIEILERAALAPVANVSARGADTPPPVR